jgi:hypothetical protein
MSLHSKAIISPQRNPASPPSSTIRGHTALDSLVVVTEIGKITGSNLRGKLAVPHALLLK